jgi:hypothetical protein
MKLVERMDALDLDEIHEMHKNGGDLTEVFVQKALEKIWHHNRDFSDMKFQSILIAAASKNFLASFIIPSLDDVV